MFQLATAGTTAAAAVASLRVLRVSGLKSPVDHRAAALQCEASVLPFVLGGGAAGSGAFRRSAVLLGRHQWLTNDSGAWWKPEQHYYATDTRRRVNVKRHDPFSPDLYKRLGLDRFAHSAQIKAHFKELTELYHPDLHQGSSNHRRMETAFRNVKEAHDILRNPPRRAAYDRTGATRKTQDPRRDTMNFNFVPKFLVVMLCVMCAHKILFLPARTEMSFQQRFTSHCVAIALAIYMLPRYVMLFLLCAFHHRDMEREEVDRVAGQLAVAKGPACDPRF